MVDYKKKGYLVILALVLVKLVVSIPFINSFPIDLDESFSIYHSQKNLSELFELFVHENNPPLHFILLHFWESIFGIDPISVRSLSLFFSVLTIPVLFNIGKILFNRFGQIVFILLFIFSDFHHYHSIEARTYSLLVLEFSILLLITLKILQTRENQLRNFIFLTLINISLFYTHYISIFIFIAELILLLVYFKRLNLKFVFISSFCFILSILPWLNIFISRTASISEKGSWLPGPHWTEFYGLFNKFINGKYVAIALIILFVGLIIFHRKRVRNLLLPIPEFVKILLIFLIIPYGIVFISSYFFGVSFFYDRYLYLLTIPLFGLIIHFFSRFEVSGNFALCTFLLVYILQFNFKPDNNRDGDKLASYVKSINNKNILLAPDYYDLTFIYHYDRDLFKSTHLRKYEKASGIFRLDIDNDFDELLRNKDSFVFIDADYAFIKKNHSVYDTLHEHYIQKNKVYFKGNYVVSEWYKRSSAER